MKEGRKNHIKIFLLFIFLLCAPVSTDKEPNKYAECGHKYMFLYSYMFPPNWPSAGRLP